MTKGVPNTEIIERIAFEVSSEVYELSGTANGNPDANSRQVKMNLNFCLDVGKGPIISKASFSPLSDIISGSNIGTLGAPDLLWSVHFLQDITCFLKSPERFGQVKCLFTNTLVVLIPPWPKPSCAATETLDLEK